MSIRILVIDPSPDYRSLLTHHLTTRWPDARITEYDPVESGHLQDGFAGAGNDLVILAHPLGEESGLDLLAQFRSVRHFPPIIVLGTEDERDIVAAIKGGAANYISRQMLSHARLVGMCEGALAKTKNNPEASLSSISDSSIGLLGLKGYKMEKRLSSGDIASVFLTREQASDREVVLKVLRQVPDAGGDIAFQRFLREFDLIGKISHPNVVRIYDLGIADDHAYIAMEFCSRGSLKRKIKRGIEPEAAEQIMRQIADALGAIHDAGILHRDLKPTNVLFREDRSVALIDFGLARQVHLTAELTGAGEIFGTPYYMSPEQGHGEVLDERSDIYSLGVIFYEMLTGEKPFQGSTAMAVILKHARDPIPRLPDELSNYQPAIDKMMAKQPQHRFQSVGELLNWRPAAA
jgi:serine/threonine-protein kinase PpkA